MSAMIVIQDDRIGFDIRLLVHHLDWLPEQESCRGDLCPYPVLIDDGISDIMNSEQGQTGDVNHHRVCFAHWPKYNVQARFLPAQSALL